MCALTARSRLYHECAACLVLTVAGIANSMTSPLVAVTGADDVLLLTSCCADVKS